MGVQGRTNLRFLDQSILDIDRGRTLGSDRFVYNPDRMTAGATISLVKGVMQAPGRGHAAGPALSRTNRNALHHRRSELVVKAPPSSCARSGSLPPASRPSSVPERRRAGLSWTPK